MVTRLGMRYFNNTHSSKLVLKPKNEINLDEFDLLRNVATFSLKIISFLRLKYNIILLLII
jgi:hypothetical protein